MVLHATLTRMLGRVFEKQRAAGPFNSPKKNLHDCWKISRAAVSAFRGLQSFDTLRGHSVRVEGNSVTGRWAAVSG